MEEQIPTMEELTPEAGLATGGTLEKIDETSKTKSSKEKTKMEKFDEETIKKMIASGENTLGMFAPNEDEVVDEDEDLHEDVDEDAEVKTKGSPKPEGKYLEQLAEDLLKNPDDYMVETPKGRMTVKEAMLAGYNPETQEFEESFDDIKSKHMAGLNDGDVASLENMMDPANLQLASADAEAYGVPENSPMRKPMPLPQGAQDPSQQAMPPEGMGGMPQGQAPPPGAPQGAPPDIASLLGGIG